MTEQGRRCPGQGLRDGAHSIFGTIELLRPPKKPLTSVLEVFFRRRSAASFFPDSQELALFRYRSRLGGGAPRSSSSEGDGCNVPERETARYRLPRWRTWAGTCNARQPRVAPGTMVVVGEAHGHEVLGRTVVVHLVAPGITDSACSPKVCDNNDWVMLTADWGTHSKRTTAKDCTSL